MATRSYTKPITLAEFLRTDNCGEPDTTETTTVNGVTMTLTPLAACDPRSRGWETAIGAQAFRVWHVPTAPGALSYSLVALNPTRVVDLYGSRDDALNAATRWRGHRMD